MNAARVGLRLSYVEDPTILGSLHQTISPVLRHAYVQVFISKHSSVIFFHINLLRVKWLVEDTLDIGYVAHTLYIMLLNKKCKGQTYMEKRLTVRCYVGGMPLYCSSYTKSVWMWVYSYLDPELHLSPWPSYT